jgi:hypothetical protein
MPSRGQSGIATVLDWNTSTNAYKTGDAANIEIFFIKDGVVAIPANQAALAESSSPNGGPIGAYSIAWTSAEGTCSTLFVGGQSSSANCAIIPITITFENLPVPPTTILAAGSGVNVSQWLGVAPNTLISGRVDSSIGQVQANGIGPSAYVPGALGTTTFAPDYLTAALIDSTFVNTVASGLIGFPNAIEVGVTPGMAWRYLGAAHLGQTSGAGTTTFLITAMGSGNMGTTRVIAIVDGSGDRSAVGLF